MKTKTINQIHAQARRLLMEINRRLDASDEPGALDFGDRWKFICRTATRYADNAARHLGFETPGKDNISVSSKIYTK